jgi:hypothetical protein
MLKKKRMGSLVAATAALALACTTAVLPAQAEGAFNATVAGARNMTPLVALETSSVQPIEVTNLPANVGLYALNCAVPMNPRSAPTLCDSSADSLVYIPATTVDRANVSAKIKVNGEFYGTNPNPQTGTSANQSVDCRAAAAPGMGACAVYILGAGRESANPTYLRIFPTVFTSVREDRKTDSVTVSPKSNATITQAGQKFSATTVSGLTPSITGDNCSVRDGKITALADSGTCTLTVTTTGGRNFKPLVATQTYNLG